MKRFVQCPFAEVRTPGLFVRPGTEGFYLKVSESLAQLLSRNGERDGEPYYAVIRTDLIAPGELVEAAISPSQKPM